MTAIGLKIDFRVAQWPELVKQSLAGTLMIWNFAWQANEPDSELFFSLAYGPNIGSANDARFVLKAYDHLVRASARAARRPGAARRHARRYTIVGGLHAVQVSSASHSAGSGATVAASVIGGIPFTTRTVGVSGFDADAR